MSTTNELSNSLRAQYLESYIMGVDARRVYDYYCYPISEDRTVLQRQSSIVVPFLSRMRPGSTAISETVDITPQTLDDTTASMTTSSRAEAIQDSEKLLLEVYTDYAAQRFWTIGENMIATLEAYLIDTALAGSFVSRGAARASLDAGTAGHRLSRAALKKVENQLLTLRCPMLIDEGGVDSWIATIHPDAIYDLETSSPILEVAEYQNANILLGNNEIGMVGKHRISNNPFAKVFGGAGADNGSNGATTLSSAAGALAKTIVVASASNLSSGTWLTIGTEETASTFYPTNERVKYVSESGTTITIIGSESNGGLMYDHASGVAVRNADSVYPILCGGPRSIAKAYASDMENKEYGTVVGPKTQGMVDQWVSLGWKWYGGFGRISENWLARIEVSSSLDA